MEESGDVERAPHPGAEALLEALVRGGDRSIVSGRARTLAATCESDGCREEYGPNGARGLPRRKPTV